MSDLTMPSFDRIKAVRNFTPCGDTYATAEVKLQDGDWTQAFFDINPDDGTPLPRVVVGNGQEQEAVLLTNEWVARNRFRFLPSTGIGVRSSVGGAPLYVAGLLFAETGIHLRTPGLEFRLSANGAILGRGSRHGENLLAAAAGGVAALAFPSYPGASWGPFLYGGYEFTGRSPLLGGGLEAELLKDNATDTAFLMRAGYIGRLDSVGVGETPGFPFVAYGASF